MSGEEAAMNKPEQGENPRAGGNEQGLSEQDLSEVVGGVLIGNRATVKDSHDTYGPVVTQVPPPTVTK